MSEGGGRNWRLVRADTDAVPTSVRRFMARARRRKLQAAMPWAVTLGVLVVAGALAWVVFGTAVLGVRSVSVLGTGVLSPAQVEQAAGVRMKQPLARADLDGIRERVEALPAVEHAVVSRSWPSTVEVRVVERTPVAAVPAGEGFRLIDAAGVAFRTVGRVPPGLPQVKVAQPTPEDVETRAALVVLGALTQDLRDQLVEIAVPAPAQVTLVLTKGRTIVWGDDTQSPTKAQVATQLLKRDGTTFDVSAPTIVTIR
jgi:cell division protein FtsQ